MKIYNLKRQLENANITTFHNLIRVAHARTKIQKDIEADEYLVINLFMEGEGAYKNQMGEHQLKPNYLTITHPKEEHQLVLPPVNQQCTLIYTPDYINNFVAGLTRPHGFLLDNPIHPFKEVLHFENTILTEKWDTVSLMKKIYDLMEDINKEELAILGDICFQETLLSVIRNEYLFRLQKNAQEKSVSGGVKEELRTRIQKAVEYIQDNYNEDISLDHLATISTMSKFHFTRTFKQIIGMSPYQYIASKRIDNAKMFLKNSHLSITEIAYEVGFSTPTSFYKFFTKSEGISPSQFRKQ
jgi:AraC family transcriptional regulator